MLIDYELQTVYREKYVKEQLWFYVGIFTEIWCEIYRLEIEWVMLLFNATTTWLNLIFGFSLRKTHRNKHKQTFTKIKLINGEMIWSFLNRNKSILNDSFKEMSAKYYSRQLINLPRRICLAYFVAKYALINVGQTGFHWPQLM